jgi:hypothetical protein
MCDWLGLVMEAERPVRPERLAPATVQSQAIVGTIVRQYQASTADLWRLHDKPDGEGARWASRAPHETRTSA